MDNTVILAPKINTIDEAAKFTNDFLRNPPTDPIEMVKVANSAFAADGVVSMGLGFALPIAAPILPMLSTILDFFSGFSGPSIGEVTLQAIGQVSQQIAQATEYLADAITKVSEFQATRTIETVLSGVNEIAKEESAVSVYKALTADSILADTEKKKALVFAAYTEKVNAAREQWVKDIQAAYTAAQAETEAQYKLVQTQLAGIAGNVFQQISEPLHKAVLEGKELLEIQKQIDEINKYISDGTLAKFADTLVRRFYGVN